MAFTAWPLASAVMFGVLGSVHPSVIMAAGTLSSHPENRAVGMGIFYTTYYAGNALAPALCGHAADLAGGPGGALYAAAAIGLLAIPLWLLHARLTAGNRRRQRALAVSD
jgi:predicted MFS family arabinose efflux permease